MTIALLAAAVGCALGHVGPAAHARGTGARAVGRAQRAHPTLKLSTNPLAYSFGLQDPRLAVPGDPPADAPPEDFAITAEQIDVLDRDGVVHIKGVLTPEWLEYMRTATTWQIEHPHMWASPGVASGLYDYIQRNVWSTNSAYARFMYYSPLASLLAKLGRTDEVRLSTDLLMVNPNKGFKWHQDNQNGPVAFQDSLRFWVTLDDTPADHGAPVYLKGSQRNAHVAESAVFVDLAEGDLPQFSERIEFRPRAGDVIVWHPRTIHKIDGPKTQVRANVCVCVRVCVKAGWGLGRQAAARAACLLTVGPRSRAPSRLGAHAARASLVGLGRPAAARARGHGDPRAGALRRRGQGPLRRPGQPLEAQRRPARGRALAENIPERRCARAARTRARRVHADSRGEARGYTAPPAAAPRRTPRRARASR
jgi:hypothetical protein